VILEGTILCEGPGCQVDAYVSVPMMTAGLLPSGWVRLNEYGGGGEGEWGFCSYECLMRWYAKAPKPFPELPGTRREDIE
jgi:hypothetical protein